MKLTFGKLGISQDMLPLALTALERHSQNNLLYDPRKAKSILPDELEDADHIFKWLKLPFDTNVSIDKFKEIMITG